LGCDQETLGFMAAKIGEHMITPATGRRWTLKNWDLAKQFESAWEEWIYKDI
jgi:hypothetical protein